MACLIRISFRVPLSGPNHVSYYDTVCYWNCRTVPLCLKQLSSDHRCWTVGPFLFVLVILMPAIKPPWLTHRSELLVRLDLII